MYHYFGNWIILTQWTRRTAEWGEHTGPATLVEYTTNVSYAQVMCRHLNRKLLLGG
jgi:hypothetical protein